MPCARRSARSRAGRSRPSSRRSPTSRCARAGIVAGIVFTAIGLVGVFEFAASATIPFHIVLIGVVGIVMLLGGVVYVAPVIVPPLVGVLSKPICWFTPVEGRIAAEPPQPTHCAQPTASGLMIGVALVATIGTLDRV